MGFLKDKVCAACGSNYAGTASSRYCVMCKVDVMDKQRKEATIRWKERQRENI